MNLCVFKMNLCVFNTQLVNLRLQVSFKHQEVNQALNFVTHFKIKLQILFILVLLTNIGT